MMVNSYRDVTPAELREKGIKYLVCDIDNTLVTYDDEEPTIDLKSWMDDMNSSGIKIAFVSNNNRERVERFNKNLGFVAYSNSRKPFTGAIKSAMRDMGASAENTALLGDQLLTDAAAANFAGIFSIIVPPIKDKKTLFFKLKRRIERPYVRKFCGD